MLSMWEITKDYLENTSFHGLPFVTQPGRHWIERVFWIVCVGASWYLCFLLIVSSYEGYRSSAISFGTDTDYSNWNTSFLSVAVCENRNKAGVYALGEKLWGKNHDYNLDEILLEIAYFRGDHYFTKSFCPPGPKTLPCPVGDYKNLSDMVRSNCSEVFHSCEWRTRLEFGSFNCCDTFLPLDTERGLCFAINSLQVKNPKPYPLISNKNTYPGALRLKLKVQAEVYVMAPEENPYINAPSVEWVLAQRGVAKRRAFAITEIINSPLVPLVPVEQRSCRFPEENILNIYPKYSYMSCIVECRADKQMKLCGCVSHLMPGKDAAQFCNLTGLLCLIEKYPEYSVLVNDWSQQPGLNCDCVPSCYEPELDLIEEDDHGIGGNVSVVELSLQRLPSLRLKRTVVKGSLDLVVSMGGSAGLFVGASLLSFVEMIYFCTVRAFWTYKSKNKTRQALLKQQKGMNGTGSSNAAFIFGTTLRNVNKSIPSHKPQFTIDKWSIAK